MKQKQASSMLADALIEALQRSPAMPGVPEQLAKMVISAILDVDAGQVEAAGGDTRKRQRTHRPISLDQQLLPFAEREYVDSPRAARILGVTDNTMRMLCKMKLIQAIDYAFHKRKRILYRSIVEFCDVLRTKHCIRDRRPPLTNSMFRHPDADLLPFSIEDTIGVEEAAAVLGYGSSTPVRKMIEEGRFEAYQFFPVSPWRISRSSLADYVKASQAAPSTAFSTNRVSS
jgi:excisionase family DNA binding protein